MATAILDVDLAALPHDLGNLDGYERALLLIRYRGLPVGRATLAVTEGRLETRDVESDLVCAAGETLQNAVLESFVRGGSACPDPRAAEAATVAVCTRERPDALEKCLACLVALGREGHQILVVDNAPTTERTRRLVDSFPEVDYVVEPRTGLNVARNRALRDARHPLVAFTDDDAFPGPGWLQSLLVEFNDPLVMCVSGLTMPEELETEAQEWHERHSTFGRGFQRRVFDAAWFEPAGCGQVGAGVNMALRREVLEHIGGFDEALDAGTKTYSGGDYEMFTRILGAGYRIVYTPSALSWHRHRRTWDELRRALYGYGVGVYAAWTRSVLREGEFGAFRLAASWLITKQLPGLLKSLVKWPESPPADLMLSELRGCLVGALAYVSSEREVRARVAAHGSSG